MHNNEKPIILIVTTLFLAFTLVYMMFFRIRDAAIDDITLWTGSLLSWTHSGFQTSDVFIDSLLATTWSILTWTSQTGSWISTWSSSDWVTLQSGSENTSDSDSGIANISTGQSASSLINTNDWYKRIDAVTGLTARYNSVRIAEVLWLDLSVVFSDTWDILYGYLGTGEFKNLASTVQRLQWNILAIDTKIDINKNWLPWDRIRFINIPQLTFVRSNGVEQKVMVAMIVTIDDDQWLIQAPYDRYHASKKRMIEIFEKLYK